MRILITISLFTPFWMFLQGQTTIRPDDHFYRRRVIQRIDLREKINQPLLGAFGGGGFESLEGLVPTLMEAMARGELTGYEPDDMSRPLSYGDILAKWQSFGAFEADDFEDVDEWEFISPDVDPDLAAEGDSRLLFPASKTDYGDLEQVIQVVEDWIFDKNKSVMVPRIRYIQLVWTDPSGSLPDEYLAVIKFEEAKQLLDDAVWVNRHNDAEHRSIREALEMRLFHAYMINISGQGIRSLAEAEYRRQALVNFEHHLFHY